MSQKIIVPRESFGAVFAISELAKKTIFFFSGAVAGRHVAINISSPVELPITCPIRARKVSVMSLDMFANRTTVSVPRVGNKGQNSGTYWSSCLRENCLGHS